jgi:hypothetical protein
VLRQREDLPVIPVALVLYPSGAGIGLEDYTEGVLGRTYLTFRYLQISMPMLPAQEYVAAQSPYITKACARAYSAPQPPAPG